MFPLHIQLDAVGGVAGDMFIAALCAAFPELRAGMLAALRSAGLPADVQCWFAEHADHALTGLRFLVHDPHEEAQRPGHLGGGHRPHHERSFAEIREALLASPLDQEVKQRAVAIFSLLAEAEGEIHGVPAERVSFHELGGNDSIADIVGAAHLIAALPGATWSVSALPLGRGRVKTAHGLLPVPSPAAARLLQGFHFVDDGAEGERVTPTGAAILKHLGADRTPTRAPRRLACTGHGFGTHTFPGLSNVLRVLVFEEQPAQSTDDSVALIAFEVDDQSPEDLAIALDHLRAHPGVLDVLQIPAFGKKGRMLAHLQILAEPATVQDVFELCFNETATLGLRWQMVERRVLARRQRTVQLDERSVRVKLAQRPARRTAKAESDDLLALGGGRAVRDQVRRAAESEGLRRVDEEGSDDNG
ncbi:MAG TPA: LarC family nickel insertion protein [Burkholderiales bacterium]|nr:LarC family nickel insertion protein [Burkholderiales bacterium]